ncbi:Tol-Pal system protein TolB [Candidatus Desulfarcum epimagneticum]|uniref:Tol-Pal system protein TolB n=1 Tax=uncultured Desulfobacteraceae bacterium TaxID=218296 RepID=A0A484HKH0_9BACT|nr:Tol-Pal system protein TolB [uncultured Desulfobacteraceae bacterium]
MFIVLIVWAAAAVFLNPAPVFAKRDYIDIDNPLLRKIPLAIPLCVPMSGSADELDMSRILTDFFVNTLRLTGYFMIIDPESLEASALGPQRPARKIVLAHRDFPDWLQSGAELLVTCGISIKNDMMDMELRLYDIYRKTLLMGKRYRGHKKDYRKMALRFCGDLAFILTGSRWLFETKIAFVSTSAGKKEVYICEFDGRDPTRFSFANSIVLSPSWSSDGRWLAYTSYMAGRPDIYVRNLKHKGGSVISRKGINAFPDWFPGRFAFAATLSYSGDPEIYLLTGDGKIVKRLTYSKGIDVSPSWSPDGKHLAFVSDRSGTPQVYVKNMASNQVRRLTFDGAYNASPDWSPKGDRIAFSGVKDGRFHIFVIGAGGGKAIQLTRGSGNNESPSWSPNASHIAFSSSRSGAYRIYVMTASGNGQHRLTLLPGEQTDPEWSPVIKKR